MDFVQPFSSWAVQTGSESGLANRLQFPALALVPTACQAEPQVHSLVSAVCPAGAKQEGHSEMKGVSSLKTLTVEVERTYRQD